MSATKIGYLLVRTIAKPIANGIKSYSKNHPSFRRLCINVAQGWGFNLPCIIVTTKAAYRFEIKLNMNLLGQKGDSKIRALNSAKAVEMGANFLGEAIIFGVAASLILWEQTRSHKLSKSRQYNLDEAIEKLKDETRELKASIEKLQDNNENLKNLLNQALTERTKSRWQVVNFSEGNGYDQNVGQREERQEDQV
ncbi:5230_t:CDS:2, partial [Acaulospora morrowiae]